MSIEFHVKALVQNYEQSTATGFDQSVYIVALATVCGRLAADSGCTPAELVLLVDSVREKITETMRAAGRLP